MLSMRSIGKSAAEFVASLLVRRRWISRQPVSSTSSHQRRRMKIGETGIAVDGHQQVRLSQNAAQHMNDTVDAVQCEAISIRTANPNSGRAERQSLDDVRP